jgi:hypothetical protein
LRSDGRDRRGRSLFTLNVPEAIAIVAGIAFFLIVIASRAASLSVGARDLFMVWLDLRLSQSLRRSIHHRELTSVGNAICSVTTSLLIGTDLGIAHGHVASVLASHDSGSLSLGFSASHPRFNPGKTMN